MQNLDFEPENTPFYWIFGQKANGKQTDRESLSIIMWAWRALYAYTVKAHIEDKDAQYGKAVFEVTRYIMSRTLAYGLRWKTWFIRQRYHNNGQEEFPEKRRECHKLIKFEDNGRFTIKAEIKQEFDRTKTAVNQ